MKRGFGTNFHKVYAEQAKLYHEFSSSEEFSTDLHQRLISLFQGKVLLDLACGTCHKANLYSKYFEKVYALDLSQSLLQHGKDLYSKNTKLNFLLSSAANIPLLDKSVDTILITWGSFPLRKTLREIKRVLRPGGVVLRIGADGLDNFTAMFPKFDARRINRIKNVFKKDGYIIEQHKVKISFKDIARAKVVLSKILGVDPTMVKDKTVIHRISLSIYTKNKDDYL